MKKIIFLISCFLVFWIMAGCARQPDFVSVNIKADDQEENSAVSSSAPSAAVVTNAPVPFFNQKAKMVEQVPAELELKVAFASQAPFGNWDALHQEACEEASMIIAAKYFSREPLDENIMEEEIQKLVKWEEENGYLVDLTAAEAAEVLQKYFGLKARLEREATPDRIKYELSRGNLVMAPAAGRELENPYYQTPGPIYHQLVIKGYDSDEFITNDAGTRRGNGFRYGYERLISAIHDWNPVLAEGGMTDEEMGRGEKAVIVISNF